MKLKHSHKDQTFPTVTIKIIQNTELEILSKLCIIKIPPKILVLFNILHCTLEESIFSRQLSDFFYLKTS